MLVISHGPTIGRRSGRTPFALSITRPANLSGYRFLIRRAAVSGLHRIPRQASSGWACRSSSEAEGQSGEPSRPFKLRDAREHGSAAQQEGRSSDVSHARACRHGGLTELGDAELTEQGVMALSGHRTPEAARLYVKRTETQRATAARKRRAWIESGSNDERSEAESQNGAVAKKSE